MRVAALIGMLVLTAAWLPATVLAQSAGDDQYVDPFQNVPGSGGGGGGGGGGEGGSGSNETNAPSGTQGGSTSGATGTAAPSDGTAGTSAGTGVGTAAGGDGVATGAGGLPRTGLALAPIGLLGLGLLVAGTALRRQVGLRRGT